MPLNTSLSPEELERYARHIVLPDIGGSGQQKLKAARVLVIGAGGLGAPVLQYLSAAGVGTLGFVDDDKVSLSNLQRQIIHDSTQVGKAKTESAGQRLSALNPHVTLVPHQLRLDETNIDELIHAYDIIADGCDNFATRFLLADKCAEAKKPLVSAAVSRFDGSLTTLKPYERCEDGRPYPHFRDLFPKPPAADTLLACEQAGIIGALTGVMGSLQAMEVIKEITGVGETMAGRLLLYDGRAVRFQVIEF